jgi:hypothetical protein
MEDEKEEYEECEDEDDDVEEYGGVERGERFFGHDVDDEDFMYEWNNALEDAINCFDSVREELEKEFAEYKLEITEGSGEQPQDPYPNDTFYFGSFIITLTVKNNIIEEKVNDGVYFAERQDGSVYNAGGDYLYYIYTKEEVEEEAEEFKERMRELIKKLIAEAQDAEAQ